MKSFVRIGQNFKAKMALNNKEWHVKTYIHQSAMKISIIHSQHSLSFFEHQNVMHQKLKFDNPFRIQLTIQEVAFQSGIFARKYVKKNSLSDRKKLVFLSLITLLKH